MRAKLRRHLTYANVVSSICLFVLLGGSAYAATTIGSKQIKDNSVQSKDIKNGTIGGKDVKNHSLTGNDFKGGQLAGPRGATGPPGTPGASNVVVRRVSVLIGNGAASGIAPCAAGERAVGGGVRTLQGTDTADRVLESGPALSDGSVPAEGQTPTAWKADVYLTSPARTLVFMAICAQP